MKRLGSLFTTAEFATLFPGLAFPPAFPHNLVRSGTDLLTRGLYAPDAFPNVDRLLRSFALQRALQQAI